MNKQYRALCIKDVTDNITGDEKRILDRWLGESDENKKEYERIKNIWIKTDSDEIIIPDTETEWLALNRRLEDNSSQKKYSSIRPKFKPAFAGIIAILLLLVSVYIVSNKEYTPQLKTVVTISKKHKEVRLPDSSLVLLNGNSRIKFLDNFDENTREVSLKGEAFFSVTKDGRPFIVKTENARTTVLGTKFNVRSYGVETEVFVKEGRVSIKQNRLTNGSVELTEGEFSSVIEDQPPASPKKIDPYVLSWIDGKLEFNQTKLREIVEELQRFYNTKITIENDDDLKNYTLTGSFDHQEIDTLLVMVCTALDIDFEKQNDEYILKPKMLTNK
jgi:transmembrane sensor